MYRKSIRTKRLEAKRKRCAAMRAAKERKRMERVSAMIDVGGIRTDGILGEHFIRILSYGDGGRHYAITVDGEHRQARTERGILRCVAQMIFKKVSQNGKGSARRRTSDARRYADGWRRVFGRKRVRSDSGGKEGQGGNNVKKVRQCVDNANRFA